jgi:hypothetical protein
MKNGRARHKRMLASEERERLLLTVADELAPKHEGVSKRFIKQVSQETRVPIKEVTEFLGQSSGLPFKAAFEVE